MKRLKTIGKVLALTLLVSPMCFAENAPVVPGKAVVDYKYGVDFIKENQKISIAVGLGVAAVLAGSYYLYNKLFETKSEKLLNIIKEARRIRDKMISHGDKWIFWQRVRTFIAVPAFASEEVRAAIENFNHVVMCSKIYDVPTGTITGTMYSPYLVECRKVEEAFDHLNVCLKGAIWMYDLPVVLY